MGIHVLCLDCLDQLLRNCRGFRRSRFPRPAWPGLRPARWTAPDDIQGPRAGCGLLLVASTASIICRWPMRTSSHSMSTAPVRASQSICRISSAKYSCIFSLLILQSSPSVEAGVFSMRAPAAAPGAPLKTRQASVITGGRVPASAVSVRLVGTATGSSVGHSTVPPPTVVVTRRVMPATTLVLRSVPLLWRSCLRLGSSRRLILTF